MLIMLASLEWSCEFNSDCSTTKVTAEKHLQFETAKLIRVKCKLRMYSEHFCMVAPVVLLC